jgi:hypothetical protein
MTEIYMLNFHYFLLLLKEIKKTEIFEDVMLIVYFQTKLRGFLNTVIKGLYYV